MLRVSPRFLHWNHNNVKEQWTGLDTCCATREQREYFLQELYFSLYSALKLEAKSTFKLQSLLITLLSLPLSYKTTTSEIDWVKDDESSLTLRYYNEWLSMYIRWICSIRFTCSLNIAILHTLSAHRGVLVIFLRINRLLIDAFDRQYRISLSLLLGSRGAV